MYCSVLYYPDKNEKLLSLLSESNPFDSVLFIFDGCRRYKFGKAELGIRSPSDLLIRNHGVLSLLNPLWDYHLYLLSERYTYSIDSLWGKVHRLRGTPPSDKECHVFIDKSKHRMALVYSLDGELTVVHRQMRQGVFSLRKKEIPQGYKASSWDEINRLLLMKKETFGNRHNTVINR